MELTALTAVAPVDGRYRSKTESLAPYWSEWALIRYRLRVEVEYFIVLVELPLQQLQYFPEEQKADLRKLYENFTAREAAAIKDIERTTNHDVKAVEYWLKEQFDQLELSEYKEFIHFGLTSQDVNNTALPMMLKESVQEVVLPELGAMQKALEQLVQQTEGLPMLARTHGQPASPTELGKELNVFLERLKAQEQLLNEVPFSGKFGGATGGFNAHFVAYPEVDWHEFADDFLQSKLSITREYPTTQISHYDNLCALLDGLKRLNVVMLDLCQDVWLYVMQDYFTQRVKAGEVGSSAMPHKVNPIDFENAEGNLGLANSLLEFLSRKLPVSRLQRDLTDSTVTRNIGVPLAHMLIALKSLQKGLGKLEVNEQQLRHDLEQNWAVVAEAIQTILRREGYEKPYEALKDLTRTGKKIDQERIREFIDELRVNESVKAELREITPWSYVGR